MPLIRHVGAALDMLDFLLDFERRGRGLLGQFLDFIGHNGKTPCPPRRPALLQWWR